MSATIKQQATSEAAQWKLWSVAETDDVDELARILPQGAHVNARNKHGMTALMRAAFHGHVRMVRALLEHGADPNLTRNDKFTALALAAFFGHTEIVRILIEHGAKTEVITRCGTSAHMWAKARTFSEAARCLEPGSRAPARAVVPRVAQAVAPAVTPAVKTLKEPPEIWDLVQEAPRGFNPRSAFVSRLTSMKTSFAFRIAAVVVVIAVCVVGALMLRGSQARSLQAELPSTQSAPSSEVIAPAQVTEASVSVTEVTSLPPEAPVANHHAPELSNANGVRNSPRKTRLPRWQSSSPSIVETTEPVQSSESREVPAAAAPATVAAPRVEPRTANKVEVSNVSPHVIAPAKSSPPKAKVIQWP
jgi:Ankyrin repeats (3 copies)